MTHSATAKGRRLTPQPEMPLFRNPGEAGRYNIYPSHILPEAQIFAGFDKLADTVAQHQRVIIDGYIGVFFDVIQRGLEILLKDKGKATEWIPIDSCFKSTTEIEELTAPFLPVNDPVFGKRCDLSLTDFLDEEKVAALPASSAADILIIYGTGAFISGIPGLRIYVDLPRNELQYRSRAQSVTNLGIPTQAAPAEMYRRFYFVDWPVLNQHKREHLASVDIFVDGQRSGEITWINGDHLRTGLQEMARNFFRVRPWFEPGAWGGKWCLQNIDNLSPNVPNYAWSFELIVPENGIVFESSDLILEVSFDTLMFREAENVMGVDFAEFGTEFPIRFDFLDTFDGGNLSIQCHPNKAYTAEHFNENITQEETYYILDTKENASLFLGFQEDIDPEIFKKTLEESFEKSIPVDITQFVREHKAEQHQLYLIPPGTIHSAGANNLVLEISATPYIYTFKLYDWLRPDLNGNPRPLNIKRGMENLNFGRKGAMVEKELFSQPLLIEEGIGWKLMQLPTHSEHLYAIFRYHIAPGASVEVKTNSQFHAMNLVKGNRLKIETRHGNVQGINYAETFVVPAAAESYSLINETASEIMVIQARVKNRQQKAISKCS